VTRSTDRPVEPSIPLHLPGVYAYAEKTVVAGETVHFRVSSDQAYELSVYRLGADPDSDALDIELQRFARSKACVQPIYPGSYVHIGHALPADQPLHAFSAECWIRPWRTDAWQGLITQHRFPDACGFGLFLANGTVYAYLGDGGAFRDSYLHAGPAVRVREWVHVVVTWNGREASVDVHGARSGHAATRWAFSGPLVPGDAPLRLGAYGVVDADGQPRTAQFLDGDLAMPVLYERALDPDEVRARRQVPPVAPVADGVLACWPLREERGSTVADVSGHQRTGTIINHASWMIGGPGFRAADVPRHGSYDPLRDPARGHGLRLASDDLYDCGWRTTQSFTVPVDSPSGLYAARVRVDDRVVYDVPFVVRPSLARPRAPIAVLCATNTWLAYSAPFAGTAGPAFSCYTTHEAGQPSFQLGLQMPMEAAGIHALYSDASVGYSHLVRAERFLHQWLDHNGYAYDVLADLDLHREPGLLDGYRVLVINGHSEYWSVPARQAVDDFLRGGGCVAVLSGNTMFWRVSFDETAGVMECRKYDGGLDIGGQLDDVGELWHSHDFLRGGMLREAGYPCWELLGVDSAGMSDTSESDFLPFTMEDSTHFLFRAPRATGVVDGGVIGQAAHGGLPRAVGHEWDARIIRLAADPPPGTIAPVEPPGIATLATARTCAVVIDYYGRRHRDTRLVSEIIYWDRPQGGRVFVIGSIGAGWALSVDAALQNLLHNVLHHFGIAPAR
jgi:N,N-dimethylformamidase